ncbi:acetyl-CoA carboxylase [Neobacillus mesonae]|uniref:acetyl-CoA carboxylase n=1 Tax=Neobacillus mesonae TaxID=1193713 RepID=UPI00083290D1|nr:acetyl-CoA carboxylase [Neobacillus mesonae]MED4204834.1 acetyl-CoA carboxylase [Neobacillus mesonae]
MSKAIIAPLPGVFYRRPAPDQPEFVQEGEQVNPGDVVGLIEIMKTFYELKAEEAGIVEKFTANNEEIVDAGQEIVSLR